MDYQLFLKCIKFSDSYKSNNPNIYFFLKDCTLKAIYTSNGNHFPNQESQNICNSFTSEMKQAQWQRNKIAKYEYLDFLEDLFKKVNFNTIDLDGCLILKTLLEYVGNFGPIDQLSNRRIDYFNQKILKLKSNPKMNLNTSNIFASVPHSNPNPNSQIKISGPKNPGINLDLPNAAKSDNLLKQNELEMARLNDIMREMKLNTPIYITNVEPGQFYNPYIHTNYIPKGVNKKIPLPMRKSDPNYQNLRSVIEKELILANQELDYHKIDMARNHLENAAYYLKNVID